MSVAPLSFSCRFGLSEGGRTYDHSYVMSSARLVSASPHSGSPPHPLSHAKQRSRVRLVMAFLLELLSSSRARGARPSGPIQQRTYKAVALCYKPLSTGRGMTSVFFCMTSIAFSRASTIGQQSRSKLQGP
jgi:hypothetical protein